MSRPARTPRFFSSHRRWLGIVAALLTAALGCGDQGSEESLDGSRRALIQHVWGTFELPSDSTPLQIERGAAELGFEALPNLLRIDTLTFPADHGMISVARHFVPASGSEHLLVYHDGHFIIGLAGRKHIIAWGLAHGYGVLAFEMPLFGRNPDVNIVLPDGQVVFLQNHFDLPPLERAGLNTMKLFFNPVLLGVNYAIEALGYRTISMIGLSGGGWTTHVYTAMDTRVRYSFPVAGAIPHELRTMSEIGDFEQQWQRPLYQLADFERLFLLGAAGRRRHQVQILNRDDPCCFSTRDRLPALRVYETAVAQELAAGNYGGKFELAIDETATTHTITPWALELIGRTIAAGGDAPPLPPTPTAVDVRAR